MKRHRSNPDVIRFIKKNFLPIAGIGAAYWALSSGTLANLINPPVLAPVGYTNTDANQALPGTAYATAGGTSGYKQAQSGSPPIVSSSNSPSRTW